MTAVDVRAATPDLVRSLAACHVACWREAYDGLVPAAVLASFSVVEREARWSDRLGAPGVTTVVAVGGGEVVGFGCAVEGPPRELKALYLRAAYHGTGTGDRLIEAALGGRPARLWVFTANARARRFYERHGFRPDGAAKVDEGTGVAEIRMARP